MPKRETNFIFILVILLSVTITLLINGCDFSARADLKRAEKALNTADALNAKFWAEPEYRKAQKAFDEAVTLANEQLVNEARDWALKAKDWAEDAAMLAQQRQEDMEREKEGLGTYKE